MSGHLIASFVNRPRRTADLLMEAAPGGMIRNTVKNTPMPSAMPGLVENTLTGLVKVAKGHMEGHAHSTLRHHEETPSMVVKKSKTRTATKMPGEAMGANIYPGARPGRR